LQTVGQQPSRQSTTKQGQDAFCGYDLFGRGHYLVSSSFQFTSREAAHSIRHSSRELVYRS
jgi:hypothetical protein